MTTWQLIRKMVQKGYLLEMGPHAKGYRGYWAYFTHVNEIDEAQACMYCGELRLTSYVARTGRALIPHRAAVIAAKLALKQPITVPSLETFKL